MKIATVATAAMMCAALASTAAAQSTRLKPGLWEYTLGTGAGGGGGTAGQPGGEQAAAQQQMAAEMAKMSPEQRKQVEAMMGQRGISVGPTGGTAIKVCITPEDAAADDFARQPGDCTNEVLSRTASVIKIKTVCTGKRAATGETTITLQSPTAYTMKSLMTTTEYGKPIQMAVDGSGKWLAAECGNVKPMKRPQKSDPKAGG